MTQPDENDLSTCAICGEPAQFTEADPGANPVSYCARHLPEHLRARAEAGQLPLQDGATKDALYERAQELDIEGRSDMTKAQLQTAVAAAEATERLAEQGRGFNRGRPGDPAYRPADPFTPDRPTPPAPRPTAEAEANAQQFVLDLTGAELEGGEMSDAMPEAPEVHDHLVETAGDEEEAAPKKTSRKGSRKK